MQTNQSVLKARKTYIVNFTSSKAQIWLLTIIHVDQTLAVAETNKYLGLPLDNHLSWKSHINVLLKKLRSVCCMMRKLSYILNIDTLRIVHVAHFQSLINYGIIFGGSSTTICNIFFIQKIIIRIMMGLGPRSYGRGRLKNLDILTVLNLYTFASIMFVVRNQSTSRLTPLCII